MFDDERDVGSSIVFSHLIDEDLEVSRGDFQIGVVAWFYVIPRKEGILAIVDITAAQAHLTHNRTQCEKNYIESF